MRGEKIRKDNQREQRERGERERGGETGREGGRESQ